MTQAVLAGLAGVSQPYISQLERGLKSVERRSTLVNIARALQVSVADLLGQPGDPADPLRADAAAAVPKIWSALIEVEKGERRRPKLSAGQLAAALDHIVELRERSDYPAMSKLLPELLAEGAAHSGVPLARVGYDASVCLRNLGYQHLALPAARVALVAAQEAGHPAWVGAVRFTYALALPPESAGVSSRVADRTLNDLQARAADVNTRQMLGQLHLTASMSCVVDGRPDDARAHLTEAAKEAATLGDPQDGRGLNLLCFGPTNVALWQMGVALEAGEPGRVLELARNVRPDRLRVANRHQAYWTNVGRAYAHTGRNDQQALAAFVHAERAAPAPFALNPLAHDAIAAMVYRARRRSVSEDLRMLARRVGVEVPA